MNKNHRYRVRIDTQKDALNFVNAVNSVETEITLEDDNRLCVSAHSMIGALYTLEFSSIYCYSEEPISHLIADFIIEDNIGV